MTSLRFVGDVPLWLGLTLAVVVAVLSWLYYRRESFELPGRLRILLPLLRSTAFLLGILILTGPVLHHRKTIGELGRVKIFLDVSQSMSQNDKHMSIGRKLKIARQIGWVSGELPMTTEFEALEQVILARKKLNQELADSRDSERPPEDNQDTEGPDNSGASKKLSLGDAVSEFIDALKVHAASTGEKGAELLARQVMDPLDSLVENPPALTATAVRPLLVQCENTERQIQKQLDSELKIRLGSQNQTIAASLDLFDDAARWRRVQLSLGGGKDGEGGLKLLQTLQERHDVDLFLIDDPAGKTVTKVDLAQPLDLQSLSEAGTLSQATNLSTTISAGLDAEVERDETAKTERQTAIVLISDGQHNEGPSPIQTARNLGGRSKPFFNVSIGSLNPAVDLAVTRLEYPKLVFQKDEIRGTLTLRDSMTPGKPFVAQIRHQDQVLWQKQLVAQNTGDRRVDFEFAINELIDELAEQQENVQTHISQLPLTASIVPLAEESESSNNSRTMRMSVITEGYRVLILDGRSRWESRFIRNAFQRDEQWKVDTIIAGRTTHQKNLPRGEKRDQFPGTRKQLFNFDLIVWGEVSPDLFDPQELEWLREFVEIRGGGIIFIDGQRGKLRQLEETDLASLVPVTAGKPPLTSLPDSLQLTEQGIDQSALALEIDKLDNQQFWTELPPPHTIVPVEVAPDAETLVEVVQGEDRYPAIVTRKYGAGTVLYLAFDESWRWRYKTADTWHQRAWHQLARFAMPQPYSVSDEFVSLDTGPATYEANEQPSIRVRLKGLDGQANSEATVDALIWKNGKLVSTVNLKPDSEVPGVYRSDVDPLVPGNYEVSIRASGYKESVLRSRGEFTVLPPDSGEMSETSVNENLLRQMSVESNGKYLREENLARLPELLKPLSDGRVIESETLLWQSYWWFAAILILLTLEWIFRKRAGLL